MVIELIKSISRRYAFYYSLYDGENSFNVDKNILEDKKLRIEVGYKYKDNKYTEMSVCNELNKAL